MTIAATCPKPEGVAVDPGGNGKPAILAVNADTIRFLQAVLAPGDYLLVRPMETWTENSKKFSNVDFKAVQWWRMGEQTQADADLLQAKLRRQLLRSQTTRSNLFFGVCPRLGSDGFDLAWQIRTVRVLWADIDDCTVDEAYKRCEAAGLPRPSIVVASGHGCHVYWLLTEPYLIDDCEAPPRVHIEWIDQGGVRRKSLASSTP